MSVRSEPIQNEKKGGKKEKKTTSVLKGYSLSLERNVLSRWKERVAAPSTGSDDS